MCDRDALKIVFTCTACGPTMLTVKDHSDNSSAITCPSCGAAFGTLGMVDAWAPTKAKAEFAKMRRETFRTPLAMLER